MASKRSLFAVAATVFSIVAGLAIAELVLAARQSRIDRSNAFDPGLFVPDSTLGWTLAANWQGKHKHWDFDASYSTSSQGIRSAGGQSPPVGTPACALLGDSFTFGLGVNDSETFAAILHERNGPKLEVQNWGLPGSSTDQQLLLLRERLPRAHPAHVILIVYVANDFFDNLRSVPMQVAQPKPFFRLIDGKLELTPPNRTAPPAREESFAKYILGTHPPAGDAGLFPSLLGVLGWRRDPLAAAPFSADEFLRRSTNAIELTFALIREARRECQEAGATFTLAVLTGRSHIEQPDTVSAKFQEALRQATLRFAAHEEMPVIDLAARLLESEGTLFYPNDGHLTPEGHQRVAAALLERDPFQGPSGRKTANPVNAL